MATVFPMPGNGEKIARNRSKDWSLTKDDGRETKIEIEGIINIISMSLQNNGKVGLDSRSMMYVRVNKQSLPVWFTSHDDLVRQVVRLLYCGEIEAERKIESTNWFAFFKYPSGRSRRLTSTSLFLKMFEYWCSGLPCEYYEKVFIESAKELVGKD